MRFIEKIQKFMYGRSGHDDLNGFLFYIVIILATANLFLKNYIISIITLLFLLLIIFRFTSKKIYKRSNENVKFLKFKKWLIKPFKNIKRNFNDRKTYVYKKCHHCRKELRLPLPSERGLKKVKCPKCGKMNKFLVLRKLKIEVVKNK